MHKEICRPSSSEESIPDDLGEAILVLEDRLFSTLETLRSEEPGPLSPLGKRIAHTLAYARARAESEVIATLHKEQEAQRKPAANN